MARPRERFHCCRHCAPGDCESGALHSSPCPWGCDEE